MLNGMLNAERVSAGLKHKRSGPPQDLLFSTRNPRSPTPIHQSPSDMLQNEKQRLMRALSIAEMNLEDAQEAMSEGNSNGMEMHH